MTVRLTRKQIFITFGRGWNLYATEAKFALKPANPFKLEKVPKTEVTVTADDAINLYTQMQTVRAIEKLAGKLYKEKIIRGFCHLYTGQEAVAVGMRSAMRPQDKVISGYRIHGWVYLMGESMLKILSELAGKAEGCSRGRGGSMHMYRNNFFGGNGIVGAQVPIGTGLALASKYLSDGGVSFTLYGDGAANQGQVFEAYNMAKLWELPCVFVCENNGYGMGTSATRSSASSQYYTRGDYIPGLRVDGMDVLATKECTKFAIDWVLTGKGPIILEMMTYRYSGHSMSDPGTTYRSREEIQQVREKQDPIATFMGKIISAGLVKQEQLKVIDERINKGVNEAFVEAMKLKEPEGSELTADIYHTAQEERVRNVTNETYLKHIRIGKTIKK